MLPNVYIDGFNLYHREIKGTEFKWLNPRKRAEILIPQDSINQIHCFTARLNDRKGDSTPLQRQLIYLRAIETLPNFNVCFGISRGCTKIRQLKYGTKHVRIKDTEEKGSDVNLATRLLVYGFKEGYQQAVVIPNNADFSSAIRYIRDELGLLAVVVNPNRKRYSSRALFVSVSI